MTNPFLRAHTAAIRAALGAATTVTDAEVFQRLRALKDRS
jgi:hypothetical protein